MPSRWEVLALLLIFNLSAIWMTKACQSSHTKLTKSRNERQGIIGAPLVYPFGGTLKLLFGYSMPVAMPGRTLAYLQNLQFQFPLPTNSSFFSDFFRSGRRRRQARAIDDRAVFYRLVEDELERRGRPGKDCIKRSICESAETPLKDDGLLGEIFHVLLTPDYGESLSVDPSYKDAADIGRNGGDCFEAFPSCPAGFGLLDHISQVFDYH